MDIITLQEYKSFVGISKSDQDAKISILISAVSALIQAYLDIDFAGNKSVTETISLDYDTDSIYLENYPVASITSVSESSRYTTDSTVHVPLVYASDYILDSANGRLIRQPVVGGFANWPISPGVIVVTYVTAPKWGSIVGGTPADLKLAAFELVSYYLDKDYIQNRSTQGTSMANVIPQSTDFPKHIQVILDRYK